MKDINELLSIISSLGGAATVNEIVAAYAKKYKMPESLVGKSSITSMLSACIGKVQLNPETLKWELISKDDDHFKHGNEKNNDDNTDPFISRLTDKTLSVMKAYGITYKRLQNSKSDEVAFMYSVKRREFEFKIKNDGTCKLSTRFVGYRNAVEKFLDTKMKISCDPDGSRTLFSVIIDNSTVNDLIVAMIENGFELDYRTVPYTMYSK